MRHIKKIRAGAVILFASGARHDVLKELLNLLLNELNRIVRRVLQPDQECGHCGKLSLNHC